MRRVVSICVGALACVVAIGVSQVDAQVPDTDPTTTTTSSAPDPTWPDSTVAPPTSTTSVQRSTTTQKTATTTTTRGNAGPPVPPPAAGPTQTLVPDLIGAPVEPQTTTTAFVPDAGFTPTSVVRAGSTATATIASGSDSPSGATLALAGVAWLASLGGVLVYAEERRASRWKHLAR
ncbi:MAG TPA: hypothetical protein VMZ22_02025 [Acidimicrobiales bacterium]|nr:hypothetical protein [Acidimicrobiales bacterium]